jgi:hypothetical protein
MFDIQLVEAGITVLSKFFKYVKEKNFEFKKL